MTRKSPAKRTMKFLVPLERGTYQGVLQVTDRKGTESYVVHHLHGRPGSVYSLLKVSSGILYYTDVTVNSPPACTCAHGRRRNKTAECRHVAALLRLLEQGKIYRRNGLAVVVGPSASTSPATQPATAPIA